MNDEELLRYSRQLMLQDFDFAGQEALLKARVLILGLGGLGSPVALYLASAGVGELVLVDDDAVELTNLQRQIAHDMDSIGMNKAVSAAKRISEMNPSIRIEVIQERACAQRIEQLAQNCSLILDCTDSFEARFSANVAAWKVGIPLVSGAVIRMEGQLLISDPRDLNSPCVRCLYPSEKFNDETCAQNGVMAPMVGWVGCLQAIEAIKLIADYGEAAVGSLIHVDGLTMQQRRMQLPKKRDCPICS
jgi:molybdopterin/thiamine biosynthesis adenylyltransferase